MLPGSADVCLSALFIDFDNIYLSLKSRDEEAASRFSRNPTFWLSQIVSGALIRTDHKMPPMRRRIAVGRCYGNPVPRRSGRDGANDQTSFAYVRHNFMRAGLEVVDCPHLTSQFKNSSDIRIACDVRDYLDHVTRFDEFIILSGDADFTPVLLSLRSHNRQTIIYANDYTSPYYKAFSDGRVEEEDLIRTLLVGDKALPDESQHLPALEQPARPAPALPPRQAAPVAAVADASRKRRPGVPGDAAIQSLIDDFKVIGAEILDLVLDVVENSEKPVPLAYLADRAQKTLGHPKTIGTNWAGSGGFLNFLTQNLPDALRLSDKPPHFVYNPSKHRLREEIRSAELQPVQVPAPAPQAPAPLRPKEPAPNSRLADLQRSITRIYEACQAPPLPPSEYQVLFTLIAAEVRENGFAPERSASAVVARAAEAGLKLVEKDVSFVLQGVDDMDPWLEHTRSASAVARAYRDFVLGRCAQAGLRLSDDEQQLIQVWFGASQWSAASGNETRPADPGLPPPSSGTLPPLTDIGLPPDIDPEPAPQTKSSPLRYSFLKHG